MQECSLEFELSDVNLPTTSQTTHINMHSASLSLPLLDLTLRPGPPMPIPFEVSFACGHSLGGAVVLSVVTWRDVFAIFQLAEPILVKEG